jgi:hypothetical protein
MIDFWFAVILGVSSSCFHLEFRKSVYSSWCVCKWVISGPGVESFQQILLYLSLFYNKLSRCNMFSSLDDRVDQIEKSRPTLERSCGFLMMQVFQYETLGMLLQSLLLLHLLSCLNQWQLHQKPCFLLCQECEFSFFKVLDEDQE